MNMRGPGSSRILINGSTSLFDCKLSQEDILGRRRNVSGSGCGLVRSCGYA